MSKWNSKNRHKFLLQYHVIFVCKYRKKLFLLKKLSDDIKNLSYEICNKHNIKLKYLETDKDHIHYMIEVEPSISISKVLLERKNILYRWLFCKLNWKCFRG